MKTQAVVFPEPNKYEIRELALEVPGPRDIVVKTLVSAISPGTERWTLRGKHIGSAFPCVPGYHRIGVVEECGAEVKQFVPGDVVYGSGNRWEGEVISMWGAHIGASVSPAGGYKFMSAAIAPRLELETLAFTIVAGVGWRGVKSLHVGAGEKLLIIGGGFIGLCAAQLAKLHGATPVLLDVDEERVAFAKANAGDAFSLSQSDLDEALKAIAPGGFDCLYDTVGHAGTTDRMVQHTRRQGRLLLQAQYFDKEKCAIDLDQVKIRELTTVTTCGVDDPSFVETAGYIQSRMLNIAPLITHRFDSADAMKGYELLDKGQPLNMGIVFRWDERVVD